MIRLALLVLAVCLVACETSEKAQDRKIRESIRKTMRHVRRSGMVTGISNFESRFLFAYTPLGSKI